MAQLKKNQERSLLHVIYYRPTHASCIALDEKLFELAARNRGRLRLAVRHSDECSFLFGAWVSGSAPTILFVRDGQAVAQLAGDLPLPEIERRATAALAETPVEHLRLRRTG